MLSSGERFTCGVTLDTGDPLVPGARQVVLLLIGQVSDLRGGEGLPVAFGDLGECVGGHRCAFLYLRTVVSLMPVPRLLSRAYWVSASAMSWCAYVHSPRMFALSHMRAVVASSGWQSSMCARTASILLPFTVGVRVGRLIRRPPRWGRRWCGRW